VGFECEWLFANGFSFRAESGDEDPAEAGVTHLPPSKKKKRTRPAERDEEVKRSRDHPRWAEKSKRARRRSTALFRKRRLAAKNTTVPAVDAA